MRARAAAACAAAGVIIGCAGCTSGTTGWPLRRAQITTWASAMSDVPLAATGVRRLVGLKFRPGTNQLRHASCRRVLDVMPGASEHTQRVKIVNANWVPGPDGDDGRFEVMFVTEDDQRHIAAPSPEAMTALIALTQADTVLAWDPADRTLIIANIVGTMPWTERAQPGPPVADTALGSRAPLEPGRCSKGTRCGW